MSHSNFRDPPPALSSLQVLGSELAAYREAGRPLHLAGAARALGDARAELQSLQLRGAGVQSSQELPA
jgi:hypothetical protein